MVIIYVLTVLYLVNKHMGMVVKEEVVKLMVIDENGQTNVKDVNILLNDKDKVIL